MSKIFITQKESISKGMHVMKCPICGNICASEMEMLPEWTVCDECPEEYDIYYKDTAMYVKRLIYPRFTGILKGNDIDIFEVEDKCNDVSVLAASARQAGEFVVEYLRNKPK